MSDWSTLPKDALESISKRVDAIVDYVRFRSVCTSWRSAAPKRPQLGWPWVLIYCSARDAAAGQLSPWSLTEFYGSQFYRPRLSQRLQPNQYICGCSRGWIALLDDAPGITLLNPFTGARIRLPRLPQPRVDRRESTATYLANNLILSADPVAEPHNCVAMALSYGGARVISCRLGADSWTVSSPYFPFGFFEDIAFFKGRCYIVSGARVFVCDVASNNAAITEITPPWNEKSNSSKKSRLVESSGDLLLVRTPKNGRQSPPHPYACNVFRVDLSGEQAQAQLVELQELGGRVLFLGKDSASLSAAGDTDHGSECLYAVELHSTGPGGNPLSIVKLLSAIFYYDMKKGVGKSMVHLSEDRHQDWWSICWLTPNLWEGSSANHGTMWRETRLSSGHQ